MCISGRSGPEGASWTVITKYGGNLYIIGMDEVLAHCLYIFKFHFAFHFQS